MTTDDEDAGAKLVRLTANLAKVEALSARLVRAMAAHKPHDQALDGPANEIYLKAAAAYVAGMLQNPAKVLEHQISYWGRTLKHYVEAQQALAGGEIKAPPPIPAQVTGGFPTRSGTPTPPSTTSSSSIC